MPPMCCSDDIVFWRIHNDGLCRWSDMGRVVKDAVCMFNVYPDAVQFERIIPRPNPSGNLPHHPSNVDLHIV